MKNSTLQLSDMGNLNRATILNLIREKGPISRTDLVKSTKLTGPTVSRIVQGLMNEGLVSEMGVGESIGGRKPILLTFRSNGRVVMGIDVRPQMINGIICDLEGNVMMESHMVLDPLLSSQEITERLIDYAENLLRASKVPRRHLAGIGVSVPGLVDKFTNHIRFSPPAGWQNLSVKEPLSERLGVPVKVGNTVEVLTLAEKHLGSDPAKNAADFVYLYVGSGIGAGIMMNGSFFRGSRYSGTEIGHTTIDLNGSLCRCGNLGCIEALANSYALIRLVNQKLENNGLSPIYSVDKIHHIVRENIVDLSEVWSQMACYLGVSVANIINTFNPEAVVIGGWPSEFTEQIFMDIQRISKQRSLVGMSEGVHLVSSRMGERGVVLGAASLVIEAFFSGELLYIQREKV